MGSPPPPSPLSLSCMCKSLVPDSSPSSPMKGLACHQCEAHRGSRGTVGRGHLPVSRRDGPGSPHPRPCLQTTHGRCPQMWAVRTDRHRKSRSTQRVQPRRRRVQLPTPLVRRPFHTRGLGSPSTSPDGGGGWFPSCFGIAETKAQ